MSKLAGQSLLESRLFTRVATVSAVVLFALVSYNSFLINNAAYFPIFKSLFNPGMFAGDIFRDAVVPKASLFYPLVALLAGLAARVGHEHVLFGLFILTNLAVLLVCYRTGRLFGPKNLALLFVLVLFTQFQLLSGADVAIVYGHHFSQTAVSVVPALLTLYWYLGKRPLLSLLALALTLAVHTKTGFAVGLVLAIVILWDFAKPTPARSKWLWSIGLTAPLFLAIAWYFLRLSRSFSGCDELVDIMVTMQGEEIDLLHPKTLQYHVVNYALLNLAAVVFYLRFAQRTDGERLVFRLIVATNLALILGAVVSFVHYQVAPIPSLMLQSWPRVGLISTWLALLMVCHFLVNYEAVWERWPLALKALMTFLVIAIFLDSYSKKYLAIVLLITAVAFLVMRFGRPGYRRCLSVIVWGFLACTLLQNGNAFKFVLNERNEKHWQATPYKTPYHYDASSYDVCTWLNRNARIGKTVVYPTLEGGKLALREIRRYSERPWFVTDYFMDYFGSCVAYESWKKRRHVMEEWFATGEMMLLAENGIGYLVVRGQDGPRFGLTAGAWVYRNGGLLVYEVQGDGLVSGNGSARGPGTERQVRWSGVPANQFQGRRSIESR